MVCACVTGVYCIRMVCVRVVCCLQCVMCMRDRVECGVRMMCFVSVRDWCVPACGVLCMVFMCVRVVNVVYCVCVTSVL